jgi:hypothetical protein
MRIEERFGKAGTRQAHLAGFETEDVLYLLPLATLCNLMTSFLVTAAVCSLLFGAWVVIYYRRVMATELDHTATDVRVAR